MADYSCMRKTAVVVLVVNCIIVLLVAQIHLLSFNDSIEKRIHDYEIARIEFLQRELYAQLGGKLELSEREERVNEYIMWEKRRECDMGHRDPDQFGPARNFLNVSAAIRKTPLFELLRSMPKGALLHVHDLALCSTDFLLSLTRRPDLWICCAGPKNSPIFRFMLFSRSQPTTQVNSCERWELLQRLRDELGAEAVDRLLSEQLTLQPRGNSENSDEVWSRFNNISQLVGGLVTYAPVWEEYYYNALKELYADGIQYVEVRSTLPILYDFEGSNYTILCTASRMAQIDKRFKSKHAKWIGSKVIYTVRRNAEQRLFPVTFKNELRLKAAFPNYFAGFDVGSGDDSGPSLREFAHEMLAMQNEVNFYLHAGETNWYGSSADENLIDAILLGAKRIGHGLALLKHPHALYAARMRGIAIEVSPISNQMLGYLSDLRNHPSVFLLANDYPVVITSDHPSFWKATPLTHDFYVTFLGIASQAADLAMLKKLALNSIYYSAMDHNARNEALEKWESQWNAWLSLMLKKRDAVRTDRSNF